MRRGSSGDYSNRGYCHLPSLPTVGEFWEESLSHELAIVGVLTAVILGAAPEDADSRLALFVDIVHDDGYLEALPVFSLSLLK